MATAQKEILKILQHNTGFARPELWVDYALNHAFQPIKAVRITTCPECGGPPNRSVGQFVYYSTLITLLECGHCWLIWADARIDEGVVRRHFEEAYKDETYFAEDRKAIFEHLAAIVDKYAAPGARILDVGGAKGHLMHRVRLRRPDVHVTVHDISISATTWAKTHFGFDTICGNAGALETHEQTYEVIVLSDVLYYEPDLPELWSALRRLLAPGGTIVIRVPNRWAPIRIGQLIVDVFSTTPKRILQDRVRYFNPEHIYIFSRRYLDIRLRRLGCAKVRALSSPLLSSSSWGKARGLFFQLASALNLLSGRQLIITPSMVLIGQTCASNPLAEVGALR